jgi:hypothetical protein
MPAQSCRLSLSCKCFRILDTWVPPAGSAQGHCRHLGVMVSRGGERQDAEPHPDCTLRTLRAIAALFERPPRARKFSRA